MKMIADVQNLPTDIDKYLTKNNGVLWLVVTPFEGELWYYSLWHTEAEAREAAWAEYRIVLKVEA